MKRFVTYLYECQRGNKIKNVGFIRVNVRKDETTLEVYIRNLVSTKDEGKLVAYIYKEQLLGVELGNLKIQNGQCDCQMQMYTENILDRGVSLHDIEGVGIFLDSGIYIASCWKDEYAEDIVGGNYTLEKQKEESTRTNEVQETLVVAEEGNRLEMDADENAMRYEKIDLSQIRDLPSPNWHLATNSFLVHGFWNYGYLVLKKEVEAGKKRISLGVPGIYEKPEAVMAVLFGFSNFESIPNEMVTVEKEKNQDTKEGTFGCWFVNLKM